MVTVLGLTFKENVPDLRNTRVIDIVHALHDFGVEVQVHDPLVDPQEAHEEYGVRVVEGDQLKPADAVVLAVAHNQFLDEGWELPKALLKEGRGIVIDVKGRMPRQNVPTGMSLWRL